MTIYEYGNPDADTVLIQLTGDHELSVLKNEVEEIRKRTSTDFRLIAAKVDDWNYELSPWKAPAVFGNEDFGDGAVRTLEQILTLCTDKSRTYYIGGYSLAGLFSLWAAYQTDVFSGIAAASPSVWFPGFIEYMKEHEIKSETVYLSLGDREEKTRNSVMSQVGNCIRMGYGERRSVCNEQGCKPFLNCNRRYFPYRMWSVSEACSTDLHHASECIGRCGSYDVLIYCCQRYPVNYQVADRTEKCYDRFRSTWSWLWTWLQYSDPGASATGDQPDLRRFRYCSGSGICDYS